MRRKVISLVHREDERMILIREDFVTMTDHRSAVILAILEYWTNVKLTSEPNKIPWIYKTNKEFLKEAMGILSYREVASALDYLVSNTNLVFRRHNPDKRYDRTYQYYLNVVEVQYWLDVYAGRIDYDPDRNSYIPECISQEIAYPKKLTYPENRVKENLCDKEKDTFEVSKTLASLRIA